MRSLLHRSGQAVFEALRRLLQPGFDAPLNPLRHLGALTIFFLWIVLVSGIWIFIFFRTSIDGAYQSVEYLTHEQWYLGGVMRSLHRYASDAAIVTLVLHILKEFFYDRYRSKRWFSWLTGVPLVWLLIPLGITGYWLVWDGLAQYVALSSAELIDRVPIFTDSMARNFLSNESLSDRFFTLMAFLHLIGLPLFLVLGIWLHVFRINRPNINPPRKLMAGALLAMLVLSLVYPALSQGPADLARVQSSLGLDWYYLTVYPLIQIWSPGWVWVLLVGVSLLLCLAPWLPRSKAQAVASVDLDNCNGCRRCVDDCPFSAVMMAPRSDGKKYDAEAVVDPDLCVSCGICVGACPTAMPFRTRSALIPGIDLPDYSAEGLRDSLHAAAEKLPAGKKVLTLCCETGVTARQLDTGSDAVVQVRCMAHLPPSYIDYILSRDLADGVFMAGCPGGDCQYRLGARWTEQRMNRERDPLLRKRVDRQRIALAWEQPWSDFATPADALAAFTRSLPVGEEEGETVVSKPANALVRIAAVTLSLGLFAALVGWLSSSPDYRLLPDDTAVVSLSFSHAGQRLEACRTRTAEELEDLPPNMRVAMDCPRGRRPVTVELQLDGDVLYRDTLAPSGLHGDGESNIYQRFQVPTGSHALFIGMRDSDRTAGFDYQDQAAVELEPGQHLLVEFDSEQQAFFFR
ncbi:MAG: hydrogenase iron-sulfur subunit [Gammaproteobacteria bacterium]|nr:hydrogenase iron-sulfur subunit [Gammaproteobacteria bacterium]